MAAEGFLHVQGTLKLYSSLCPGAQRSALPKAAIEKWETTFIFLDGGGEASLLSESQAEGFNVA